MRKIIILIFISQLFLYSCESDAQKLSKQDNVLLAKEVTVTYPVVIVNEKNPEWTSSLDCQRLYNATFKTVMENIIPVYGGGPIDFEDIENQTIMPSNKIPERMGWKDNDKSINALKEILFYEKWGFDSERLKLSKEILGWCPIKVWKENDKELKKKIFYAYPKNQKKGKKIAGNIITEINWYFEYPTTNVGFDQKSFLKFIIDGIKSGRIEAYDPIYLVDKSKRKFTTDELSKYIGQDLNAGLINSILSSMLFEEDWYFDESTLCIQKEVKSIAFVQEPYDSNTDSYNKKIMFFIFPKE